VTTYGNLDAQSLTNWNCSGLPPGTNCDFGDMDNNSQVSLRINTTASANLRLPRFGLRQRWLCSLFFPGFLAIFFLRSKHSWHWLRLVLLVMLLSLGTVWLGCGGTGSHGTPTGTNTITVSAAAGGLHRSTTITLTIK
jgi:hypothetical protein